MSSDGQPVLCVNCGRPIKRVGIEWRHLPTTDSGYLAKWCTIAAGVPLSSNPKAEPSPGWTV